MEQFQVIVEHAGHRLFTTEWVTGKTAAIPLAMLIGSKFPEHYSVLVSKRTMELASLPWDQFVVS